MFNNLLYETLISNNSESFVKKYNETGDIELAPVYFSSTTKKVINSKYDLGKS